MLIVWVSFLSLICKLVDQSAASIAQVTYIHDGNICKFEKDPANISRTSLYTSIEHFAPNGLYAQMATFINEVYREVPEILFGSF